jgi:hypothetical protein
LRAIGLWRGIRRLFLSRFHQVACCFDGPAESGG